MPLIFFSRQDVGENVPQSGDGPPVHLRVAGADVFEDSLRGLAEDLQIPKRRVERHLVGEERLLIAATDVTQNLPGSLAHIVDEQEPAT